MNRQNGNKSPKEALVFSLFTVLFMVYWTYSAIAGGAPVIFWAFGGLGLYTTVRNAINAFKRCKNSKNDGQYGGFNQYNDYNNTANYDPWDKGFDGNAVYGQNDNGAYINGRNRVNFCPYCGTPPQPDHDFCKNCGRQLPD